MKPYNSYACYQQVITVKIFNLVKRKVYAAALCILFSTHSKFVKGCSLASCSTPSVSSAL